MATCSLMRQAKPGTTPGEEKEIHTGMRGGTNMAAVRENTDNQTEDVKEFISLLKDLDYGEKREIKGIMIGMRLTKQLNTVMRA